MDNLQGILITFLIIMAVIFVLSIAIFWKLFEKAGQPGWAAIVPIYNVMIMLRIVGRPEWWVILVLIPCVNIIFYIYLVFIYPFEFAKAFGKDAVWGILLLFFGIIAYAFLAFGDARYEGPVVGPNARSGGRSRRRFDDEDDYDDRGRGRGRDRDDDDDDRGRGRGRDRDDDDDDRPRRRD
jgi:Family of unknown function (DUF5684)